MPLIKPPFLAPWISKPVVFPLTAFLIFLEVLPDSSGLEMLTTFFFMSIKGFFSFSPFNLVVYFLPSKVNSFLPAFPGAKPYHSAFDRGVKIIGATSHYITEELDAGPIIEQDISRVTHLHQIQDFLKIGRDLERVVLVRALKMHTDRKVMVYNNKTIVFV